MPALAVVGEDHRIIRSTETFRRKCHDTGALRAPEVDLVLTGQTDSAVLDLGGFSVAIEAVTDAAGRRQAMLSLPEGDLTANPDGPLEALRDAADESPALVWAKDLEGRYLYINARYEEYLETSEDRLKGNTDADLPLVETVDGPRLRFIEDDLKEPLQLEYTVPSYESRPAMAAFRFPLLSGAGTPIGTCGVAAPSDESDVARDEAVRLMQLERWNRLDPVDVRAELLQQWHVQATPGPIVPVEDEVEDEAPVDEPEQPVALAPAVLPEPAPAVPAPTEEPELAEEPFHREDEWVRQLRQAARISTEEAISETADALQCDLQLARKWAERADELQGDLHEAHLRLREAEAEAQQASAQARRAAEESTRYAAEVERATEQLGHYKAELQQAAEASRRHQAELEEARAQLDREKAEADSATAQLEVARSEAEAARHDLEVARRELGAARAQSESLKGPADAALRLSEELGRVLTAERERGDELARTLARVRSRLGDLEGALDRTKLAKQRQPAAQG